MHRMIKWTWLASAAGVATLASVGCSGGSATDTGTETSITAPEETAPDLTVVDEFTQDTYNAVNVLWVIDTSWATPYLEHVDQIAVLYEQLLLHGIPWRVALMTPATDPEPLRGELQNEHQFVESFANLPNNYAIFPSGGQNNFRAAVHWTLTERIEEYQEFYFAGGHLSIIAFTDNDDRTPPGFIGQQEFIDFLLDKQDVSTSVSISAITVGNPEIRDSWLDYAEPTNGVVTTSPNVALNLERVALASLGLTKTFTLSEVPAVAPQSLILTYRGNQRRLSIGEDYEFDFQRNAITLFGQAPFAGSRLTVTYQRRVEGAGDAPADGAEDPTDGGTAK